MPLISCGSKDNYPEPRVINSMTTISLSSAEQALTKKASSMSNSSSRPPRCLTITTEKCYSSSVSFTTSSQGSGLGVDSKDEDVEQMPSPLSIVSGERTNSCSATADTSRSFRSSTNKPSSSIRSFNELSTAREVIDALQKKKKRKQKKSQQNDQTQEEQQQQQQQQRRQKRGPFYLLTFALEIIGGIGAIVENIVQMTCHDCFDDFDEDDSYYKRRRERDQLLDDINRIDRMNSFDTFGTINTISTINTVGTNDTGYSSAGAGSLTPGQVDDDGNVIPIEKIKEHMARKQVADKLNESTTTLPSPSHGIRHISITNKNDINRRKKKHTKKKKKKKRRRNKSVGFEYPPISRMRHIPRVNSEERKKLFFEEDELDNSRDDSLGRSESEKEEENENIPQKGENNPQIKNPPKKGVNSNMNPLKVVGVKNNQSNVDGARSSIAKGKHSNTNTLKEVGSKVRNGGNNNNAPGGSSSKGKLTEKMSPLRHRKFLYHKASPGRNVKS